MEIAEWANGLTNVDTPEDLYFWLRSAFKLHEFASIFPIYFLPNAFEKFAQRSEHVFLRQEVLIYEMFSICTAPAWEAILNMCIWNGAPFRFISRSGARFPGYESLVIAEYYIGVRIEKKSIYDPPKELMFCWDSRNCLWISCLLEFI